VPDPSTARPSRRDRRGRGLRGPLLPDDLPGARSRAEQFDELVVAELTRVTRRFRAELDDLDVLVEEVPPDGDEEVRLFRTSPAAEGRPARLVVHRRPVEARARGVRAREDLVHHVVVEAVAELLGLSPEDVDPDHDDDLP
jgi:predicted Zn-dependent protease with MMP-like domain